MLHLVKLIKRRYPEKNNALVLTVLILSLLLLALGEEAASICNFCAQLYANTTYSPPWIAYLACRPDENDIIGTCAFKSKPQNNRVEIAYYTFAGFENQGYASEMASQLISLAWHKEPMLTICAQTLPEKNASTHILQKLGFTLAGETQHPEDGLVWEWHLYSQTQTKEKPEV